MDHSDFKERFQKAAGAIALQQLLEPTRLDPVKVISMSKAASADIKLLEVASLLDPNDPFGAYESLGGEYTDRKENTR